ncbi:PREDICTED: putative uncharacterized protein DDB_G0282133 [Ceratosolen solmsi marchali]|uniref:Uncharacterized protein n=1 Tax=Ceratosolen solmsi marchali TaxID=326594 RepID=A0AAJ6YEK0_9HYME|nr:PREDICTED: putative uncharacterized protein DDB_G0282133 [Ceratosolen solmsi marchali]
MELTEAVQFPKPINECLNNKVIKLPDEEQITQDKSKHFNNKSMEIAEVVPVHKNYLNVNTVNIMPNNQENQDIFMKNLTNNTIIKPSLMTDTIYDKNRQAAINIENKLDETEKEKTNMFLNNSNELTEAVPIHHRIHESENNINKIVCKSTCTSKRLPDKPMELTEFTPIHNVGKFNATNTDNNLQGLLHERTSICNNARMKNNKCSTFHMDSELPRCSIIKNLDASLDKNALCNTLASKIFPVFEQINKNISTLPSERNFIGNTKSDESLKIMKNTSLDKHSEFTTTNRYSRSAENLLYKSTHETNNELNMSVDTSKINHVHPFINETNSDVTKNIQTGKSISAFDSKKENYNPNDDENTKIFLNKSMELTEAIATGDPYLQDNKIKEDLQIDSRNIYHDSSMEMTLGLPSISSQPKHNIHKGNDNALVVKTVQFSYDRLDTLRNTLEASPELEDDRSDNVNSNKKNASCQQVERDSIQVFHDISMEDTLGPTILTNSTNNLTKLNHYTNQSILSSNIDMMSNSINGSKNFNKENNYEPSIRYSNREESFHRITSDELNTLCASMNLPTLRCSRSESVQNNYISLYNDASVHRNSFKNNTNFQQQPTHTSNTFSEEKEDFNNRIGACESFNKGSNFQVFCDADSGERDKNFSAIQTNPVDNCVKGKNFDYEKYQQRCDKVTVYHDDSIEMRKNLESPNKSVYRNNVSDYVSSVNPSIKIANNFHNINNESNRKSIKKSDMCCKLY